jgi:WD40 repeat protein
VSGHANGTIVISNTNTGDIKNILDLYYNPDTDLGPGVATKISFNSDGTILYGSSKGIVGHGDIETPDYLNLFNCKTSDTLYDQFDFLMNGLKILSYPIGGAIRIWNSDGHLIKEIENNDMINSASFKLDGSLIVAGFGDDRTIIPDPSIKRLQIIDGHDYTLKMQLDGHTTGVSSTVFSPVENIIVSGDHNDEIRLWFLDTYIP